MTDLEMTKLCAEVIGKSTGERFYIKENGSVVYLYKNKKYDPLHDDTQAMALVKKLKLNVECTHHGWNVYYRLHDFDTYNADLNRAIVECVALMQKEKA